MNITPAAPNDVARLAKPGRQFQSSSCFQYILKKPKDLRFEELEKVIIISGYHLDHSTGSHAIYTKKNAVTLTIPRKTPVKSYLLNQVLTAIGDCLEEKL